MFKTISGLALTALLVSGCGAPATVPARTALVASVNHESAPDAITAAGVTLTSDSPAVTTIAAPAPVIELATVLAPVIITAPAIQSVAPVVITAAPAAAHVLECQEDEPCWDCKTMGNHICGPVPAPEYVPCVTDETGPDFPACYWDASERGNGLGQSFTWTGTELIYTSK